RRTVARAARVHEKAATARVFVAAAYQCAASQPTARSPILTPCASCAPQRAGHAEVHARHSMNPTPLARLLIVDDESAQVLALCHTLAAAGYATSGAGSGPEALCALRTAAADRAAAFDVLVTDLMMPGMDGIALLRAAQEIDPDLVGLLMTGHGTGDTAGEATTSCALHYIPTPF